MVQSHRWLKRGNIPGRERPSSSDLPPPASQSAAQPTPQSTAKSASQSAARSAARSAADKPAAAGSKHLGSVAKGFKA